MEWKKEYSGCRHRGVRHILKRRVHQHDLRGFNRKAKLHLAEKDIKKTAGPWEKLNLPQRDGMRKVWRQRGTAHDPKHFICETH